MSRRNSKRFQSAWVSQSSQRKKDVGHVGGIDALETRRMLTNLMPVVLDQVFSVGEDATNTASVGTVVATDADNVPGLQFNFGNVTGTPLVLSLTSFDDGLADNFVNQIYQPTAGTDPTFHLTSDGQPVATGAFTELEVITNMSGDSTGTFTLQFTASAGGDSSIFDEIIEASGGTGIMTAALGVFDYDGVDIGISDAELFSSTGTGTFQNGGSTSTVDFQFDAIASNLDVSLNAFGIPGEHPFQDINVGRGAVTAVTNLPVTSGVVQNVSDPLTYEITGGTGAGVFDIDPLTGEITVANASALDATGTPSYTLDVQVTDSGVPALSDDAVITVNVTPAPMASPENLVTVSIVDNNFYSIESDGTSFTTSDLGSLPMSQPFENLMYGDFNGDELMDLVVQHATLKSWHVGINNGTSYSFSRWLSGWNSLDSVFVGDFNGDGTDDLIGRRSANGNWRVGISNGSDFIDQGLGRGARGGATTFSQVAIADFDNDGTDDRGVYDQVTRHWFVQLTGSGIWSAWGGFWPTADPIQNWQVGDFNGDGRDDIAGIRNSGRIIAGFSDGSDFTGQGLPAVHRGVLPTTNYQWFGTGDFDGDGSDEIVAQSPNDAFYVTDVLDSGMGLGTPWRVQSVDVPTIGDFNGDGRDDIAGLTPTGQFEVLRSTGTRFDNPAWPGSLPVLPTDVVSFAAGTEVTPATYDTMPPVVDILDSLFGDEDELDLLLNLT